MNLAVGRLGYINALELASGAAAAYALACLFGAARAAARVGRYTRETSDAAQCAKIEFVARKNFARSFAQPERCKGEDYQPYVEDESYDQNNRAGHDAYRGARYELVHVTRGLRVQVNFKIPTESKENEEP